MNTKKTVTIKFNSNLKTSGTNSNANYLIDWSAILKTDTNYSLTWTYVSQQNTFTTAPKIASVYMNIFGENYIANVFGASITLNIGNLIPNNNALYADTNTNMPLFHPGRPLNNNVNIQILTNDNPPIEWTDTAGPPVANNNYILTLLFSEL